METKVAQIARLKADNTRLTGLVNELSASITKLRASVAPDSKLIWDQRAELAAVNEKLNSSYSALGEQQVLVKTLVAVINDLRAAANRN